MTWLRNSAGGYGHYFARLSVKSIIPIMLAVLASLLFVLSGSRGVLVRAQLPPKSESVLVLREYFSTPLGLQESCVDACERIGGFCNPERITELALDVQQCHDAVIGHMEWVNSGDPQGRYALFPTGSGQNDNATGGCVVRTKYEQDASSESPLTQIQIRSMPFVNGTLSSYTGFECEVGNPSVGTNWSRLCPCIVNATSKPSPAPSAAPSLLVALNTIYLRGVSLAQLKWFCGLENFIEIFRTTLVAVYDLEKDELGEISVFELNIAAKSEDIPGRVLGISFYIVFRTSIAMSSAPLLIDDLDTSIKASIRNNVLLEVLESLGSLNNCSLRNDVVIVGLNENVRMFDTTTDVDIFSSCNKRLGDNHHSWDTLFEKESYGVWLILLATAYCFALLAFIVLVLGNNPSCLVYGTANASKFKHLWTLLFSLILLKILFFITILASWKQNNQYSFACTERFFITGTTISSESLSLLQQIYLPIAICVIAGLLYVDLGLDLSYSSISGGMSCLAFGPFIWLYIIMYIIFAYLSTDLVRGDDISTDGINNNDNFRVESNGILGKNDREISQNVLSVLFGCILIFVSCIWLIDLRADFSSQTIKHRGHAFFVATVASVYGTLVIMSSIPVFYSTPTNFFFINSVFLRILELLVVLSSFLFLVDEMNTPSGKPPFVSTSRMRGVGQRSNRPISYPRGPRGVSFDPICVNSGGSRTPPTFSTLQNTGLLSPPPQLHSSPMLSSLKSSTEKLETKGKGMQLSSTSAESHEHRACDGHTDSPFPRCHNSENESDDNDNIFNIGIKDWGIQSPPLVPTTSSRYPPYPSSPPPPYFLHNDSFSLESPVSSADTFPLSEPLWLLGSKSSTNTGNHTKAKMISNSSHSSSEVTDDDKFRIETSHDKTRVNVALLPTTQTSNASSVFTSSAMSPSEMNIIRDHYYEEGDDESYGLYSRTTSQFSEKSSTHGSTLDIEFDEKEEDEEDELYEHSVSVISSVSSKNSGTEKEHSTTVLEEERSGQVGIKNKVFAETEGILENEHESSGTAITPHHDSDPHNHIFSPRSSDWHQNVINFGANRSNSNESSGMEDESHVSTSRRSTSSRSNALGEVNLGPVDTVAYFNL